MEEIDAIIVESLRNLNCDIEENATSLRHFDADMVVSAISRCLETIIPDMNFPKKLPPSMSIKLKITSSLAKQIKDLGFRDDIGYQTILYCNEAEIRRVLMFLIERLPREQSKVTQEQTGYVPSLVKQIEEKVKTSLNQCWVPSCVLRDGYRKSETGNSFLSLGNSRPLRTTKLQVPCINKHHNNEALKEYWIRNVPVVTKQCSPKVLLPSLLFEDCLINADNKNLRDCFKLSSKKEEELPLQNLTELVQTAQPESIQVESDLENKIQSLVQVLKTKKEECIEYENSIKTAKSQLKQTSETKVAEEETLQNMLSQVNLKSKTLTVIRKDENLQKLKNMIDASRNKLLNLTEQWNNIQAPLIEEYNSLQNVISNEDLKQQKENEKMQKMQETHKNLTLDLDEKTHSEDQLRKKLDQVNKTHTRSSYTRRILEIISNIKKQDEEIQKILKDTRLVQREISTLTGQVDRSFTLADELIFRDAKSDETARRAYKILAQLRDDCAIIIKGISDLGTVERECRNLQEQSDSETAKENAVKLERVNKDLDEMKKETQTLLKQQS